MSDKTKVKTPSRGLFVNTGSGPALQPIDIDHKRYMAVIDPDTAFWALVKKSQLALHFTDSDLLKSYKQKAVKFADEMQTLRFGLKPSGVYFNPTERCNLNCTYCYIPEKMRRDGKHMSEKQLLKSLKILKNYFNKTMDKDRKPNVVFHGAEPMLNKDAMFAGIEKYKNDFLFGVQTNATLLDEEAIEFLVSRDVSIGISLDAPAAAVADKTRISWTGQGTYDLIIKAMNRLKGYDSWSVICTVTEKNMRSLPKLVDFLHKNEVPTCLLNVLRCTLPHSRDIKSSDAAAARYFIAAMDRTHKLYSKTGRKLIVANFANILISILAPTARRLMCDISPCGGGRSFFALAPNGDMFPCSEFIGLKKFKGGNLFRNDVESVLESKPFRLVTGRKVEDIEPCRRCAIRHFCGSPCPAEAHEMNGRMDKPGAFCEFYEEQTRYALRLIADSKHEDFLWPNWDKDTKKTFDAASL